MYAAGARIFVEIGPKNVLTNLVKNILGDKPHEIITFNPNAKGDSDVQFRQAVLQMRVLGFSLGNIDPHRGPVKDQPSSTSKVAVMLNGGLYTTDATKQKFEQALKATTPKNKTGNPAPLPAPNAVNTIKNVYDAASVNQMNNTVQTSSTSGAATMTTLNDLEHLIEKLQAHQSELLKAHEQYLQNDRVSKTLLQQVTEQELSLISNRSVDPADERAFSVVEKRAEFLASQHEATSNAHQAYIQSQTDFTRQYAGLIQGLMGGGVQGGPGAGTHAAATMIEKPQVDTRESVPVIQETKPVETPVQSVEVPSLQENTYTDDQLSASFLAIVSEKTGYPVDMLELGMDMEADLGIDSIKRVEILGAMQEQYPELPTIEAEQLVELRTLAQVIGAFQAGSSNLIVAAPTQMLADNTNAVTVSPSPSSTSVESGVIQESFLEIVSEKTGYPVDMLELSMDMEADLGIDSIKRVEILGAVQEKYPELPTISAEELVELRTLSQVIGAFTSSQPAMQTSQTNPSPADAEPTAKSAVHVSQADADEVQAAFLEIVSEKTGYPTDMLELGMDMEADLGIDSIKRVEILGAVQERFPELPSISAEELVELRTLEQIISKFNAGSPSVLLYEPQISEAAQAGNGNAVEVLPVSVQSLPKPDRIVVEYPENSTVLITANDAEKAKILAERFLAQGLAVGMIHLHSNGKLASPAKGKALKHYTLEEHSENGIEALMQSIRADQKRIVGFIHLESSHEKKSEGLLDISDDGTQFLKTVFLMARHLKMPLQEAAGDTRPAFMTVTQMDGEFGLNGYQAADPLPGGFGGLVKSLRREWTQVFCRALDFHPQMETQVVVQKIEEELFDADLRLSEVGYTPEGRFTLTLDEAR